MENFRQVLQDYSQSLPYLQKDEPSKKICRVCFDEETSDLPMISPCECSGSIKYIHEDCLKKWILSKTTDPKNFSCDVCKFEIRMEIRQKLVPSCKGINHQVFTIVILPFIILIFAILSVLVLYYLTTSSGNRSITKSIKIYLFTGFILFFTIDIVFIFIFIKAVIAGCCKLHVTSWKIYSNQDTVNITSFTELTEKNRQPVEALVENPVLNCVDNKKNEGRQSFIKTKGQFECKEINDSNFPPVREKKDNKVSVVS